MASIFAAARTRLCILLGVSVNLVSATLLNLLDQGKFSGNMEGTKGTGHPNIRAQKCVKVKTGYPNIEIEM